MIAPGKPVQQVMLADEPAVDADADVAHASGIENEIAPGLSHAGLGDQLKRVRLQIELLARARTGKARRIEESQLVVLIVGLDQQAAEQLDPMAPTMA